MLKINNGIEITQTGHYIATVDIDGVERSFHINSQSFDNKTMDGFANEVMHQLRKQEEPQFYEYDRNGNRRYNDLTYFNNDVWLELLRDDGVQVNLFFEFGRFY